MIVQEKLADASTQVPASETPETPISLESQSCDELREIASRGVHVGELYFAAVKELERRANDTETALETEQATAVTRQREIVLWVMILSLAVAAAGIARLLGY